MRALVDVLVIVSALSVLTSLLLGLSVLIACLLKSPEVSRRFFNSRRFFPVRIVRFFSKRRYTDTAEPNLIRLGETTLYLSQASMFFTGVTVFLVAVAGWSGR